MDLKLFGFNFGLTGLVSGQRLQHGLNESFFEPVDDFSTLISHMKRGFSLPGYAVVIKVELYPARLMTSIDCEMDRNGNVYRGLSTAQPDADGNGLPKCGYFYLFNLGSPHFCTMSTVSSSVPAVNSVASLGESLLELGKNSFAILLPTHSHMFHR